MKLFISVPKSEFEIFESLASTDVVLLEMDETDTVRYFSQENSVNVKNLGDIRSGYLNQQLRKIIFCVEGNFDSVMCLESDFIFVRDFGIRDFIPNEGNIYYFGSEIRDLQIDSEYFLSQLVDRNRSMNEIAKIFDTSNIRFSNDMGQLLHKPILQELLNFLELKNLTPKDAIQLCPYEYAWYSSFLQTSNWKTIRLDPVFKIFHTRKQLGHALLQGLTVEELRRGYLGYVVNSNVLLRSGMPFPEEMWEKRYAGDFLPLRDLIAAVLQGVLSRFTSRLHGLTSVDRETKSVTY